MTYDPLFTVENQVVLVSGASRGIGFAIAKAFAERGARVTLTGRDAGTAGAAAASIGHGTAGAACDVTDPAAGRRLVDGLVAAHGHLDTLINVAGVNRRKPALDVTEDDYDAVVDANLRGAFFLSQAAGRHMVARGSGNQINIGSLTTILPGPHLLPYAVSKAGIGRMTQVLALEWGPHNVRVNAIAPGFIITDLTRKLWSHPKMLDWGIPGHPLRRLGTPDDLVSTALYLASPGAAWMTGQVVTVDGGFTAGWNWPIDQI
jgi:NAD(P)-dependent dehydrogenase (short-subunit alcohol dehydrogenase family)